MDSKDCMVRLCGTDARGDVMFFPDHDFVAVYDARHRCIVRIPDVVALTKALLEAQQMILPVDEFVEQVRERVAMREAFGDLVDALGDELKVEISRNPHVQEHVRQAIAALGGGYGSYNDAWWLS